MDRKDQVRAGLHQILMTALVVRVSVIGGGQAPLLDDGAHGPVEDQDPIPQCLPQQLHPSLLAHWLPPLFNGRVPLRICSTRAQIGSCLPNESTT